MSNNNKLKILLFGEIADQVDAFLSKLRALHASKAGPFDAAFCVGACSVTALLLKLKDEQLELPIPVYLQEASASPEDAVLLKDIEISLREKKEEEPAAPDDDTDNVVETKKDPNTTVLLGPNLYYLRDSNNTGLSAAGIWRLKISAKKPELVVGVCPRKFLSDAPQAAVLQETVRHVSYTGCDLLLTTEWPQGIEQILAEPDGESQTQTQTNSNISFDVADIALAARARYQVAPSATFLQSPPFEHLSAATSTVKVQHTGRFLGLAKVKSVVETKAAGKAGKFVHALSLTPLHSCSVAELQSQRPAQVSRCPFTDASYQHDGNNGHGGGSQQQQHGLSEASARRILAEERSKQGGGMTAHRWISGNNNSKRRRDDNDNNNEPQEVDPMNTTLYIYGLHKDVTGQLQSHAGDPLLWQTFQPHGIKTVRRPPNAPTSSFAFLDFATHEAALRCLEEVGGVQVVKGVDLELRWATRKKNENSERNQSTKRQRLTEAEARDSSSAFFRWTAAQPEGDRTPEIAEILKKWMEATLEDALAGDGDEKVTAESEPALQVKVRLTDKDYGFLDFASHAAASMALATITGSTDGGVILPNAKDRPEILVGVALNWAHAKTEKTTDVIEDASGFCFERKHFPADSRKDCWFCLASESCEKHLITGVFNSCYAAMPKGPVHQGHVLLIPVQHSSQGALYDPIISDEMDSIKAKLREHAARVYDMDLFVFERAIQTKRGYHTHVQCIPVEKKLGLKLQTTMLAQAQKADMQLRELNSDLGLASVLNSDDENDGGYFYAEIPGGGNEFKRYLHKANTESRTVPLQFGREVLAAVLGKPELAHWKSCVVDKDQEAEIAAAFRKAMEES
jgi:diadenosine tetraphosphate (Ap4A) HIT family hydrolase